MKRSTIMTGLCVAGLCAGASFAQTDDTDIKEMTIGSVAPPLDITHVLKGEAPKAFEDGKVYVVEFWATWCGPCIASMPHITELQKKYQDYGVQVVGVSDEPLPTVVNWLLKEGNNERTGYTLTTDPDESVKNAYFRAAGRRGIPCAFIVGKDGHVEWIGHPMRIDEPLEAVVKDSWDRSEFKSEWEASTRAEREAARQREALMTARRQKDWDTVMSIYDGMIEKSPSDMNAKIQKFMIMLIDMNEPEMAYDYASGLVDETDNAMALNSMSWQVLTNPNVKTRNTEFALRAATKAAELSPEDAAILDTLARAYHDNGMIKKAMMTQRKAVELAPEGRMKEDMKKALATYEAEMEKTGGR